MAKKSRLIMAASLVALGVIAACGGNDNPLFNLGTASSDGVVSPAEATRLLGTSSETGEPENVSTLALTTSDEAEPFDLPD